MPDYNTYLKRKQQELRRQSGTSYAGYLRQGIGAIGRQSQQTASQVQNTLRQQNVPLSARVDVAGELNQQYAQQVGQQTSSFIQQEQGRQAQLSDKLAEVNAAIDEAEKAKKRQTTDMAIQVSGTVAGAALGSVIPGVGTMIGAQVGSSVGQVASGGYNIAKGQGEAQDWANIGEGIVSGAQTVISETKLNSVKAKQQGALGKMQEILNDNNLTPQQKEEQLDFWGMQYETGIFYEPPAQAPPERSETSMANQATSPITEFNVPNSNMVVRDGTVLNIKTGESFPLSEINQHGLTFEQQQAIVRSKYNKYSPAGGNY